MSRDYLITSARTKTLQAGVLAAFVVVLTAILVQSVAEHQRGRGTLAGSTAAPPAASSMDGAPQQSAGNSGRLGSLSRREMRGRLRLATRTGPGTVYPRSPIVRADAEDDPTTLGQKAAHGVGDKAQASRIWAAPSVLVIAPCTRAPQFLALMGFVRKHRLDMDWRKS